MPTLFRRREVLLPTLWGWLLVLAMLGATTTWMARQLGAWLAVSAPVAAIDGGPAVLLVVEGWLGERELDDAAAYARSRGYSHVVTSGGAIDSFSPFASYAERAAHVLHQRLPGVRIDAVPTPRTAQDRSYASAVWVRDWAQRQAVPTAAIDVYSLGVHARRSRTIYRLAFGGRTRVGIIAGMPHDSDVVRWWTTSEAAKAVLGESLSLAWTHCCFWPAPHGTHDERWGASDRTRPTAAP